MPGEGGAPQGVNSGMLSSMDQHGDGGLHAGSAIGSGQTGLGSNLGKNIGEEAFKKSEISFGTVGTQDILSSLPVGGEGALQKNPFQDAFDGNVSPFGVSHAQFEDPKFIGNVDLSEATSVVSGLNMKTPTISSASRGG